MIHTILDKIVEASISIDAFKKISFCNEAFLLRTGYTKKDLIGTNFFDFVHINDFERVKKDFHIVRNDFPLEFFKFRFKSKGKHKYIHFLFHFFCDFTEKSKKIHLFESIMNNNTPKAFSSEFNPQKFAININNIPNNLLIGNFQKTFQFLSQFNIKSRKDLTDFFAFHSEKIKEAFKMVEIVQFNTEFTNIFQITHPNELMSGSNTRFISEIQAQLFPFLLDIIQNRTRGDFELIYSDQIKKIINLRVHWMIPEIGIHTYERVAFSFTDETSKNSLLHVLGQSEHRYKRIIESFGGEIYTCSEDDIVEYANTEAIRRQKENPVGKKCFTAIYGLDQRCSWCQNERLFDERKEMEGEKFNPRNKRWYHVIVTPNLNPQGKRSKSVVMIDITEQKKAKDVLTTHSKRLEVLNQIYRIKHEGNSLEVYFKHLLESSFLIGDYNSGCIIVFEKDLKDGLLIAQSNMSNAAISEICKNQFEVVDRTPTFINDIKFYIPELKNDPTVGSIAFVPILFRNQETGVLILVRESSIEFSNPEMEFLLTLGKELGAIIKSVKAELELKESLSEKEILLKEIHHRVKNNLQIIISLFNLQKRTLIEPKIKEIFEDSKNRIKSMSLIHEILYQTENYAKINYNKYIRTLVSNLIRSYRKSVSDVESIFEIDEISIDINDAIPLALILNELVSNALKYAYTEELAKKILKISLKKELNQVVLIVADNGKGIPKGFNVKESKSLGLRLVSMLTAQLHGTYEVSIENGTKITIVFIIKES